MVETKLTGPSMEERIANRLKNSGEGLHADHVVRKGDGPTRTFHNIVNTPNKQRGGKGES
jgi:hypothetical protein